LPRAESSGHRKQSCRNPVDGASTGRVALRVNDTTRMNTREMESRSAARSC
jgi:hypothetical protein